MDKPYRVLYIDDDEMLLDVGKIYLEKKEGFLVDVTTAPSVVLESLQCGRYDAIISDYEMPVMNGIDLLKAVREKDRSHPFILFTGRGREDVVIEALNNGADFYLQKGGEPKSQFAELAHKVRQAIMLKRTEQSLKTSVQELSKASTRYAALIAASHTGAWEYHADTRYLWCSPEYFSMLGRDVSDYDLTGDKNIQETWQDLLHPDDRGSAIRAFDAYLNQPDGMYEQYFRMLHADGHYVWIWSRGRTILDDEGNPTSITVGTHIDITGRKQAEESLKLVNSKLEWQTETLSILNLIISAVNKTHSLNELLQVFLDSTINLLRYDNGGIYLVNDESHTATLAYSKNLPEEFLNPLRTVSIHETPFDSLFVWGHPLISKEYPAISRHAGQFGIQSIASIPIRVKDRIIGALNIGSYSGITIKDLDIRILESICTELGNSLLRMKTEEELQRAYDTLKKSDEELRKKQDQLIGVAETLPGAIFQFMVHPDGEITMTYVSKQVLELFGYSGDNKDFLPWFTERVDLQDRESFQQSLLECIRSPSSWRFEGRFIQPSKETFWFEAISRPVQQENVLIFNGVLLDITDRKRAEFQLVEKVQELKDAYDVIAMTGEDLRANLEKLSIQEQALRESEEKFRTLFESAGDAIIILDNGVIYDCNHQTEVLFRLSKVRLIGKSPVDFAPALQPDEVCSKELATEKLAASQNGNPVHFEFVHQYPDGTQFFTEVTLQQIQMQGRMFQQAIIRDVTLRKKAEAELVKKNEELATAYEEILSAEEESRANQQLLIRKDQDLQQTKNHLDDIISFLPDAAFVINRQGIVIAWNRAMEDLTTTVSSVSSNVEAVSQASNEADALAQNGIVRVNQAETGMNSIRKTSADTAVIISDIQQEMAEIGNINNIITSISDQINLLALNAAIEAARAGDAGRGFAVVADEVKSLATQTGDSANKITRMIEELSRKIQRAEDAMSQANLAVSTGAEAVEKAMEIFNKLNAAVYSISKNMESVAGATEEQAASFQEITASVQEMSDLVKETAKDALNSSATAEEALSVVSQINQIIYEIEVVVATTNKEMNRFIIRKKIN